MLVGNNLLHLFLIYLFTICPQWKELRWPMAVVYFREWSWKAGSFKPFPNVVFESSWFDWIQGIFSFHCHDPFDNKLFIQK